MDTSVLVDQQKLIFIDSMRILDTVLKTYKEWRLKMTDGKKNHKNPGCKLELMMKRYQLWEEVSVKKMMNSIIMAA